VVGVEGDCALLDRGAGVCTLCTHDAQAAIKGRSRMGE
jgi:hypothetical protein